MKVLLIGATGNIGLRMIPALLSHNHTITAYVRNRSKLLTLLPPSILAHLSNDHDSETSTPGSSAQSTQPKLPLLSIVQGSGTDVSAIKDAILTHNCDAVVNTAGLAAMMPWGKSELPEIFQAVLDAAVSAGEERGKAIRMWFLGGISALKYPGTETRLVSLVPIFPEHAANHNKLLALNTTSSSTLPRWSMLWTPATEPSSFTVPAAATPALIVNAEEPPHWKKSWVGSIPLIGRAIESLINTMQYETTLEQNAEMVAKDFEEGGLDGSPWLGKMVGTMDAARARASQ